MALSNLPWILNIFRRKSLTMHLHSVWLASGGQLEIGRNNGSIARDSMLSLIHWLVSLAWQPRRSIGSVIRFPITSFLLHKLSSKPHLLSILPTILLLLLPNISFRAIVVSRRFTILKLLLLIHIIHCFDVLLLIHCVFFSFILCAVSKFGISFRSWTINRVVMLWHVIATSWANRTRVFIKSLIDIGSSTYQCIGWRKLIKLHF